MTEENVGEVVEKLKAGELPAPAKSLAEAMHRVMTQVGYIQKKGTVTVGQGYKFAGERQFIEALRPEMVAQGIVVAPVDMQALVNEVFPNSSGKPQNRTVLRVTFRFTHVGSGQTLDVVTCGEGIDNGDKATNKAMTGAMKYALRQAFLIETGNDPDETPSAEQERQAIPQKPTPAKPDAVSESAREIAAAFDAAASRADGKAPYERFDRALKADKVSPADRAHVDAALKRFTARFPKPAAT